MKPTIEQEKIIDFINTRKEDLKISAFAGTGKTSTLKMIANSNLSKSFLYLAYNKDIQVSAVKSFPKNVYCVTYHALARRAMQIDSCKYKDKLMNKIKQSEVIKLLGLNSNRSINPYQLLPCIKKTVNNFKISSDMKIGTSHVDIDEIMNISSVPSEQKLLIEFIVEKSKKLWQLEVCQESNFPIDHDTYVKMWQLSGAKIEVDCILFDEAQDANPVVLDIISQQKTRKIFVGDHHQKIYAWRGAVNAMQEIEASELSLTQSFRFGPAVAEIANKILAMKGENRKLLGFEKIDSKVQDLDESKPFTCVCRTNAEVFSLAIHYSSEGKKISICGGIGDFILRCKSAYYLFAGKNHLIEFYEYKKFQNWNEFVEVARFSAESNSVCKIIKKYEHNILSFLDKFESFLVKDHEADVLLCTAHKSKGLEWDQVCLGEDYSFKEEDELNLVYVACTRAREILKLSDKFRKNLKIKM